MSTEASHSSHHIVPLKVYLLVGAALFVLTAVTVLVSFIQLGGFNAVVAVGVASIKATLVALFFMHLLYDKKIFLIVFLIAILFLTIFIGFTMFDVLRRGDIDAVSDKPIKESAIIYDESESDSITQSLDPDSAAMQSDSLSRQ